MNACRRLTQTFLRHLKAAHGVLKPDGNGTPNWRLLLDVGGLSQSVYGTGLRLVCDLPGACLRYYLGHSLCATAGVTAAYVN